MLSAPLDLSLLPAFFAINIISGDKSLIPSYFCLICPFPLLLFISDRENFGLICTFYPPVHGSYLFRLLFFMHHESFCHSPWLYLSISSMTHMFPPIIHITKYSTQKQIFFLKIHKPMIGNIWG